MPQDTSTDDDRTSSTPWGVASAVGFDLSVLFHAIASRWTPEDYYASGRFGLIRDQLFFYARTPAGVTPPWPEMLIQTAYRPLWETHPMGASVAGYSLWAVPFWPLPAIVVMPAAVQLWRAWKMPLLKWVYARRSRPGGFSPIIRSSGEPAVESPGSDGPLTPPVPASRTPGSASSARPR